MNAKRGAPSNEEQPVDRAVGGIPRPGSVLRPLVWVAACAGAWAASMVLLMGLIVLADWISGEWGVLDFPWIVFLWAVVAVDVAAAVVGAAALVVCFVRMFQTWRPWR